MRNNILRALLFHNKKQVSPSVAVAQALIEYKSALHTKGFTPQVAQFHYQQKPTEKEIAGLRVVTANDVPINQIRIACLKEKTHVKE